MKGWKKRPRPAAVCECGEHAWVPLTKGFVTFTDPADVDVLARWRWCAVVDRHTVYVLRAEGTYVNGERISWNIPLHRQLLCPPPTLHVDHADKDGLNNRRANLRPCSFSQNMANRRQHNSTGYRGVSQDKRYGYWTAYIQVDKKLTHLGTFPSGEAAARAYDAAALAGFGEFAQLNFPRPDQEKAA